MLKVSAIQCPECKHTIFSRARHDYHACPCGKVTIDGGFDYCHVGWEPGLQMPSIIVIKVNATKQELYDDWNRRIDKFGTIPPKPEKKDVKSKPNEKDRNPARAKAKPRKARRSPRKTARA